jgi:membrane associated rhomboid family serine protease
MLHLVGNMLFLWVFGDNVGDASVGWWAHNAGFVTGLALTPLVVRPGTPLLGRDISIVED